MSRRQGSLAWILNVVLQTQRADAVVSVNPAAINVPLDLFPVIAIHDHHTAIDTHRTDDVGILAKLLSHVHAAALKHSAIEVDVTNGSGISGDLERAAIDRKGSIVEIEGALPSPTAVHAAANKEFSTSHGQRASRTCVGEMNSINLERFTRIDRWTRIEKDSGVSVYVDSGNLTGAPVRASTPATVTRAIVPRHISRSIACQHQH